MEPLAPKTASITAASVGLNFPKATGLEIKFEDTLAAQKEAAPLDKDRFVVLRLVKGCEIKVNTSYLVSYSSPQTEIRITREALKAHSVVFNDLFEVDYTQEPETLIEIGACDFEPEEAALLLQTYFSKNPVSLTSENAPKLLEMAEHYDMAKLSTLLQELLLNNGDLSQIKSLLQVSGTYDLKSFFTEFLGNLIKGNSVSAVLQKLEEAIGETYTRLASSQIQYNYGREHFEITLDDLDDLDDKLDLIESLANYLPIRLVFTNKLSHEDTVILFSRPNLIRKLSSLSLNTLSERVLGEALLNRCKTLTTHCLAQNLTTTTLPKATDAHREESEINRLKTNIQNNHGKAKFCKRNPYCLVAAEASASVDSDIRELGKRLNVAALATGNTTTDSLLAFLNRHPEIDTVYFKRIANITDITLPPQIKKVQLIYITPRLSLKGDGVKRINGFASNLRNVHLPNARDAFFGRNCFIDGTLNLPELREIHISEASVNQSQSFPKVKKATMVFWRPQAGVTVSVENATEFVTDLRTMSFVIFNPQKLTNCPSLGSVRQHPKTIRHITDPTKIQELEVTDWIHLDRKQFMKLTTRQKVFFVARALFRAAVALSAFTIATLTVLPAATYFLFTDSTERYGFNTGVQCIKDVYSLGKMLITGKP